MRKPLLAAAATTLLALGVTPTASADHLNCSDFKFQEEAQAVYDNDTSDPNGLDGPEGEGSTGEPGVACEDLPSNGGEAVDVSDFAEPGDEPTDDPTEDSDDATEDDDSQMEETPQGGVDTGDGGTSGIENAGLIGAGSLALLGGATLLARRRFATDN